MHTTEQTIEVNAPLRMVYNQWTQFEEFPRFMEGVKVVRQIGDRRLHWVAEIAGEEEKWDAVIDEQVPDQRIAWRSTDGGHHAGVVTFRDLGPERTQVTLKVDYEPEGVKENGGSALGLVDRRVKGDLERFKDFIEARGRETGAWRGEIHGSDIIPPTSRS